MGWIDLMQINLLKKLLQAQNPALLYFVERDLLNNKVAPRENLFRKKT